MFVFHVIVHAYHNDLSAACYCDISPIELQYNIYVWGGVAQ